MGLWRFSEANGKKQKEQVEPLAGWGVNSGRPPGSFRSLPIEILIDERQRGKIIVANGEK